MAYKMTNKNPLITEKEWLTNILDDLKTSIEEIKNILLGEDGKYGLTHRVHYLESEMKEMQQTHDKQVIKTYKIIALLFIAGSLLFIKESRDVLFTIFLGSILP